MLKRNTTKILLISLLLLSGCSVNDCRIGYDITVEQETRTERSDSKEEDKKEKSLTDKAKELRKNMVPGAQITCSY